MFKVHGGERNRKKILKKRNFRTTKTTLFEKSKNDYEKFC